MRQHVAHLSVEIDLDTGKFYTQVDIAKPSDWPMGGEAIIAVGIGVGIRDLLNSAPEGVLDG